MSSAGTTRRINEQRVENDIILGGISPVSTSIYTRRCGDDNGELNKTRSIFIDSGGGIFTKDDAI
jgi:hypothetical protein